MALFKRSEGSAALTVTERNALIARINAELAGASERATPGLRRLRRMHSRTLQAVQASAVLRLACALAAHHGGCPRWLAYELVHHHASAMSQLSVTWLNRLGAGLASWGEVDAFGCYLLGPAWRMGNVTDGYIVRWARSKDRWRRRAALVATVALNTAARGGHGDAPRTLAVCMLLLDDRDDMVVKALSWALRALAVRVPSAVERFVDTHRLRLAARVQREVRNKLTLGLKTPRKRTSRDARRPRRLKQSRTNSPGR